MAAAVMSVVRGKSFFLYGVFALFLMINAGFWLHSRSILPAWGNIPPAPGHSAAVMSGLGDEGIAYRLYGYSLQNFGNTGGRYESLRDYDYKRLEDWFFLAQSLDDRANYVPFMAAYYFGAVDDRPEKVAHVVNYLAAEGEKSYPHKWRWLAQAVYLARYKQNDLPRALELANRLAVLDADVAPWGRQLPAFVQLQMGNKEAAYEIMIRMLATERGNLHPNEVNAMRDFICTRTLDEGQAAENPLCQNLP